MGKVCCPRCGNEIEPYDLPWTEDDVLEICPSCDGKIYIVPVIIVRHKVALNSDQVDFVDAI